jgi:hypothetical protein
MPSNPTVMSNTAMLYRLWDRYGLVCSQGDLEALNERIRRKLVRYACGEVQKASAGTVLLKECDEPGLSLWRLYVDDNGVGVGVKVMYDHKAQRVIRVVGNRDLRTR